MIVTNAEEMETMKTDPGVKGGEKWADYGVYNVQYGTVQVDDVPKKAIQKVWVTKDPPFGDHEQKPWNREDLLQHLMGSEIIAIIIKNGNALKERGKRIVAFPRRPDFKWIMTLKDGGAPYDYDFLEGVQIVEI